MTLKSRLGGFFSTILCKDDTSTLPIAIGPVHELSTPKDGLSARGQDVELLEAQPVLMAPSSFYQQRDLKSFSVDAGDDKVSVEKEGLSTHAAIEPVSTLDATLKQPGPHFTLNSVQDAAFKRLEATDCLSSDDYKRVQGGCLQDVLNSVNDAVTRHFDLHRNADKFRSALNSLLERLGKYETAIDMLAQSMPQFMGLSLVGLIWGSLKILLVRSRVFVDTVNAVVDLLDDILKGIPALEVYVQIFGASRIRLLEEPLVVLYAELINFGIQAAKLFDDKGDLRLGGMNVLITKVKQAEERVDRMASVENMNRIDQALKDERRNKILEWLAAPDPSSSQNNFRKRRQEKTGEWFFKGELFEKWRWCSKSFLWIHAIPGCGKTILCSAIIDELLRVRRSDPSTTIAYFYITDKQGPEHIVRSLVKQLSAWCAHVPEALATLYDQYQRDQQYPTTETLLTTIQYSLQDFQHVYLVLDALDECTDRVELLTLVEEIGAWKLDKLHVLVTSRKEHDISERLESLISHSIDIQDGLTDDIEIYIRKTLETDLQFTRKKWLGEVQEEIKRSLVEDAHGMFRWVALQLDGLKNCRNGDAVKEKLKSLPKDLDETYDRILSKVKEGDRAYAIKILQCLAFSARPVTLEEVGEVVASTDRGLDDALEILEICSSLVTLAASTDEPANKLKGVLGLAHFTVKEYLISERIRRSTSSHFSFDKESAETFMCRSCLAYLMRLDPVLDGLDGATINQKFPLLVYAAKFWTFHAQSANAGDIALRQAITDLLQPQSIPYSNWVRLYNPPLHQIFRRNYAVPLPPPVYYASYVGVEYVVLLLLEKGAEVNARGGHYGNALQAVSCRGHEAIVQLLLENGAEVNAQGGHYGNALQAASWGGHEAIVRLVLQNGAEVNARGGYYGNALQAASCGGHEAIVRLLLENGAEVNAQGGQYDNPLQAASWKGHETIVRLLLETGATVNDQGGEYGNALQAASWRGHQAIVRQLLENGAEVNAQGGRYNNALQAALQEGHEAIVRLLLENGAEVNAQGGYYGNALQAVSCRGHNAIVRLLLKNGAEVNAQGGMYGSALQAASQGGHKGIVQLLVENGAEVDAQGGYYGNALQAASWRSHEAIVRLLLEKGAEVNAQGGVHGSALQAASQGGHTAIVQLLVEKGALNCTREV